MVLISWEQTLQMAVDKILIANFHSEMLDEERNTDSHVI